MQTALLKSSFTGLQRWCNNCTTRWMTICKDNTKATEGSFFQIWIGEPWKLFKPMNIKKGSIKKSGFQGSFSNLYLKSFEILGISGVAHCPISRAIDGLGVSRLSRSELTVKSFTIFDSFDKTRSTAETSILSTSVFKTSDSVTSRLKLHLLFKASMTCD